MALSLVIRQKLSDFKRKYYRNEMVQGGLLLLVVLFATLLSLIVLEGLFYLSPAAKTFLFFASVISTTGILVWKFAIPAYKLFFADRYMSDKAAAKLLGKHFPEMADRLENLLELSHNQQDESKQNLLFAAISQKEETIRPIPFTLAIDIQGARKLVKVLAIPMGILLLMYLATPTFLQDGSRRFFAYTQQFEPPPPYTISIEGHKNTLISGEDFTIAIKLTGKQLPQELFIYQKRADGAQFASFPLTKRNVAEYSYTFRNVSQNISYYIGNELHGSVHYHTEVVHRPALQRFYAEVFPPAYTGLIPEIMPNGVGDFRVLAGSTVRWHAQFAGALDSAWLHADKKQMPFSMGESGTYVLARQILEPVSYYFKAINTGGIDNIDTTRYQIDVVYDRAPTIVLREPYADMQIGGLGLLTVHADITDDFGFSKAVIHYKHHRDPEAMGRQAYKQMPLKLEKGNQVQSLIDQMDFFDLDIQEGEQLELYVEVWDNDIITGPKSATTSPVTVRYSSLDDLYANRDELKAETNRELEKSMKESERLLQQLADFQRKLLDKQQLGFEDKQELKSIADDKNNLIKELENIKDLLNKDKNLSKDNRLLTEETLKKRERIEDILEQLKDPETKKLLDELEKRMDQLNKLELKDKLDKLEQNTENMKEDLERTLDLLKQLEKEETVQELVNKLNDMLERQQQLMDKTEELNKDNAQDMKAKQDELKKNLEKLADELDKLDELADSPEEEEALEDIKKDFEEAKDAMEKASEELEKNKKSKSQQQQQESKESMENMSNKLSEMQMDMEMQQQAEDYQSLRYLLENLLHLSFDQEDLRDKVRKTQKNDPAVFAHTLSQQKISDDMVVISDSLKALASRNFTIQKFITDELALIQDKMGKANFFMTERRLPNASSEQHQIMGSVNKLANMLVDALSEMQENMQQMKGKGKACMNPKSMGGKGMKEISKEQQKLNDKMQEMLKKQGQQEGKGDKMKQMAKEQEDLRKALKEAFDKLNEEGEGGLGDMDKVQKHMEETEEELKRQELTAETLLRQQRILNRMLDFDKAMREQEYDEKRKGTTASDMTKKSPAELTETELQERIRQELYNSKNYRYTRVYKTLIEDYFSIMEKQ